MTILEIKCGWCQKPMGEKDGKGQEGETTGICDDCLLHHFPHHYARIKAIEKGENR